MGALANKDLISIEDFSKEDLLGVVGVAKEMEENRKKYRNLLRGKILATFFFEPYTRKLSFDAAMVRLGGNVTDYAPRARKSLEEEKYTLEERIMIANGLCDAIVIKHPEPSYAIKAAEIASVPVINAGDSNHDPTQTLVDIYTIKKAEEKLEDLNIGFFGELKNAEAAHWLVLALSQFNPRFSFVSSELFKMPEEILGELRKRGILFVEETNIAIIGNQLNLMYLVLNPKLDSYAQSLYFAQPQNDVPVRQAILAMMLGEL